MVRSEYYVPKSKSKSIANEQNEEMTDLSDKGENNYINPFKADADNADKKKNKIKQRFKNAKNVLKNKIKKK